MPKIEIQQATFERLQHHAKPLIDTFDTVINQALDALELEDKNLSSTKKMHKPSDDLPNSEDDDLSNEVLTFAYRKLPNVRHSKILEASIDGVSVYKPNWQSLVSNLIVRAMKKYNVNFDELCDHCKGVKMFDGKRNDRGFVYYPEIKISIQRMGANVACGALKAISHRLELDLKIDFEWRNKEGAVHPGERGRLDFLFASAD